MAMGNFERGSRIQGITVENPKIPFTDSKINYFYEKNFNLIFLQFSSDSNYREQIVYF
jgi:hypothetical protein